MTSTSQVGETNITLQFDLNRGIDAAAQDVQAAISPRRRRTACEYALATLLFEGEPCAKADSLARNVFNHNCARRLREVRQSGLCRTRLDGQRSLGR